MGCRVALGGLAAIIATPPATLEHDAIRRICAPVEMETPYADILTAIVEQPYLVFAPTMPQTASTATTAWRDTKYELEIIPVGSSDGLADTLQPAAWAFAQKEFADVRPVPASRSGRIQDLIWI